MVENISRPENYEQPYASQANKTVKSSSSEKVTAKEETGPQETPEISPEREAEIAKAMEKLAGEFEKTEGAEGDIMYRVLKALRSTANSLQELAVSQSESMKKKTGQQRFMTDCLNDIPIYDTVQNPPPWPYYFKPDDSDQKKLDMVTQANQKWGIETQRFEAKRSGITDDQKSQQAGLSRTDDFQKQIVDMMNSFMQAQSQWCQSIVQR